MSRSYRKTPITGVTMAHSEKWDKQHANRKLRRKVKAGRLDLHLREVSDIWGFEKDGKSYWGEMPDSVRRK